MKPHGLRLVPLGSLLFGCSAVPVDYAGLQSAASARQHWSAGSQGKSERDVSALLAAPLTADSAARIALLNNRGARAATERLGIAQAELAGVKHLPNPTLEGAVRFRKGGDPDIDLAAMLDLTALFMTISKSNAAHADVAAEKLEAVAVMVDVSFDARRAFVDYQAALERVELHSSVFAAYEASAAAAQRLREAGNITLLELASHQASSEEARLSLAESRAEAAAARERVNAVMGLVADHDRWKPSGPLPELPERELALAGFEKEALAANLHLASANKRCAAAAEHAGVANVAGWLPELKAGVSAERGEEWGVGPAVELELPLFYQGQGEAGLARVKLKQTEDSYGDLAVRVRSEAVVTRVRLEAARSSAVHARDVVLPLRAEVVKQTQLEYSGMLAGVFTLLEAKRDQLAAAERYLSLRHEYWRRRLDAEQLLAGGGVPDRGQGSVER